MMLIVIVVVLLLLVAAVAVAAKLGLIKLPAGGGKETLPYCKKEYFFSKAEAAFYRVLTGAVGGEFLIFAKVRMCDLVEVVGQREGRQGHPNRVQSKHVDFVLCDPERIKPMLAIELDDSSHQRQNRQTRDAFVNEAFTAAGLPLLRIPASRMYDQRKLAAEIEAKLSAISYQREIEDLSPQSHGDTENWMAFFVRFCVFRGYSFFAFFAAFCSEIRECEQKIAKVGKKTGEWLLSPAHAGPTRYRSGFVTRSTRADGSR